MKIKIVRFNQAVMLGTQLDVNSSLSEGQTVLGRSIEMSYHDSTFLKIKFLGENPYCQLIPWAQVATVIYEETSDKSYSPSYKAGAGKA